MIPEAIITRVQAHLARGDVEKALVVLISLLSRTEQRREYDNALLLKAQWEGLKQEQLKGLLSREDYETGINRIMVGVQDILKDVEGEAIVALPASSRTLGLKMTIILFILLIIIVVYQQSRPNYPKPTRALNEKKGLDTLKNDTIKVDTSFKKRNTFKRAQRRMPEALKYHHVTIVLGTDNEQLEIWVDQKPAVYMSKELITRIVEVVEGEHEFTIKRKNQECSINLNIRGPMVIYQSNFKCH